MLDRKWLYNSHTVSELIADFRETTEQSDAFVFNSRLEPFRDEQDFQKVDYIILGDFPGGRETELGMYFAGDTGKEFLGELQRLLVKNNEPADHKFLILNKSLLSKSVHDEQLPADAAQQAQEYMATLTNCCYQKINEGRSEESQCQIWIFGDDYKDEYKYFYEQLSKEFAENQDNEDNVYVFPHPLYGDLYETISDNGTILDVADDAKRSWDTIKSTAVS